MSLGEVGQRVIIDAFGETPMDALENHLRLETQEPPEPSDLGDEDVVVRVRSAAVGWVDLLMSSGQYQHMAKPPYVSSYHTYVFTLCHTAGVCVWARAPSPASVLGRTWTRVLLHVLKFGWFCA